MPTNKTTITVEVTIQQPIDKVWELWTKPEHITQWNFAADSWHCPSATNDPQTGGHFSWRMEAKDGSMGFDFSGVYEQVVPNKQITAKLGDGRQLIVVFADLNGSVKLTETFEVEDVNTVEEQKTGWQMILDNFKKYAMSIK